MAGAVVSATVILKLAVPVLPAASVAEQVTVVVPIGNCAPDLLSHVVVGAPLTASVAVAGAKLTAAPSEEVASWVLSAAVVRTGLVVSTTLTRNVLLPSLPALSVAVHTTVV